MNKTTGIKFILFIKNILNFFHTGDNLFPDGAARKIDQEHSWATVPARSVLKVPSLKTVITQPTIVSDAAITVPSSKLKVRT